MEKVLKILFVEDVLRDAALIWRELKKIKIQYSKLLVDNREDYIKSLETFKPDIILSDYRLPQFDGMTALLLRNEHSPLTPFILVTGSINEVVAVECMKAGADDYILKDNLSRLGTSVINSLKKIELLKLKKEAEIALRESEERFRILYNDALVGLYRTNLRGEIVLANKTLVKMLGYQSFEELAAINLKETSYGPSYTRQNFIDQIEKEGEVKDLEATWICRDGSEIFIRESARAIYGADREILYYDGTVQNITEQKRAAEALNKIQHLFETLAMVSPVGIFRTDKDGRTTYVNPKWLELSGLTSEDAIDFEWLKAVHPDDREQLKGRWKSDVKSQMSSIAEYRFLKADGSIVWVMGNAAPEMIDNEIVGYIGTITDITNRKQAEMMVRENESSLRDAQRIGKMGSWEWDLVIQKTNWSDNYFVIHGFNPTDIEPNFELFRSRIHPDDVHILDEKHAAIIKEKTSSSFELRLIMTDGTIKWIQNNISPVIEDNKIVKLKGVIIDITQRKLAEEKLINSEERLKILFDYAPDAYYLSDIKGNLIDGNIAAEKLMGYTKKELIGRNFLNLNLLSLKQLPKAAKLLLRNSLGRGTGPDEFVLNQKDGSKIDVEIITHPVKIKDQILVLGIARDISERSRTEKFIRESEEKYRRIFENVQDVYYETSLDGTILEISPSIEMMSKGHYLRDDLKGKSMYNFYSDTNQRDAIISELKERGTVKDIEIILINRDGSKVPCSISSRIILDAKGHPEKIIGSMHDITERKRAEEELKHNLAFSESLLKTIPFGMHIVDTEGTILFQSDNFKKLFGEEAIGKKCWDVYRDDKKQCYDCPLMKGITIGETEVYESKGVLGNRIFEIIHTGMLYKGKKAILEIFQDITARKENEEELIQSKEKAEESDRLKTAFLHNISHEIRTPMNAIVGFSALLGESDVDAQTRKSYIEVIMQSSDHLLAIITDIVDISNIEANLIKAVKNEINLNSTLKSLCNQFLPKAREKRIQLVCDPGLSQSDAFILTDKTKLTQILSNLISNSLKFTDRGNINVGYKVKDGFLEFSVSDTGIGIPHEYQEKIFDRFYQVQNTVSRIYEGIGLGLAISKAYVELLGGKIWLDSKPETGATFYFTIPYERSVSASEPAHEKPIAEERVFKNKITILVAEDVESNFKLLKYFLSDPNIELLRAGNGKEAVEQCLSGTHIDLVLMDIKMPVMDGYTAAKIIRESMPGIPIIAQTAYADDRNKAKECGCNGFISKPFDKKRLMKVLAEFI